MFWLPKIYCIFFFLSKIAIYLYLGLLKGRQSYRTLQPSKNKIPHFLDPNPDPDTLTGSETLLDWLIMDRGSYPKIYTSEILFGFYSQQRQSALFIFLVGVIHKYHNFSLFWTVY
jgi:hypothetical protein